jgi:hypothetical protein
MRVRITPEALAAANRAALLDEAAIAEKRDALRWRWVVRHASLGFNGAPAWDAVVSLPMYDADDNTLTAIVDRGLLVESGAEVSA